MKNTIFRGAASAIITPFDKKGNVDYDAFEKILNWQVEEGINGLVIAGTSGEGATLSDEEHREVLKFCKDVVGSRVPLIAGTGSNDTAYAVSLTRNAYELGYDAALLVSPYYNKATQRGLIESFLAVANTIDIPCILYNVPSRTGCNILPATVAALADHPNIVGVKEASGDIAQITEIASLCGDKIDIYSGNDDQIVPVLSVGGSGVISVLSNVVPAETALMCRRFFEGDIEGARELQLKYFALVKVLFCEVNPIPVKAAMAAMGMCDNELRLPLTPMEEDHFEAMAKIMRNEGLIA